MLTDRQYLLLQAVGELDGNAYTSPIREKVCPIWGRDMRPQELGTILPNLEERRLLKSKMRRTSEYGREARYYELTKAGRKALQSRREEVKRIYGL